MGETIDPPSSSSGGLYPTPQHQQYPQYFSNVPAAIHSGGKLSSTSTTGGAISSKHQSLT